LDLSMRRRCLGTLTLDFESYKSSVPQPRVSGYYDNAGKDTI
jgi:hypothetical protein